MMTARTAGSPFQSLSTAVISARIGVSQALSFHGLLSVIVPMPPLMSVRMTALLMECSRTEDAYRKAQSGAVKCAIERRRMFGKHASCSEDNHDWQIGACGCAGHAHGAHSGRRRGGDGLRGRERAGCGPRGAERAAASRVQRRDARGLLPDGCVPGLLGVARRPLARARLHDSCRRRDACALHRAAGISKVMKVAIVGAGPAGVAAADVLAAHGVAVTVIDEGREAGGQIYRRARAGLVVCTPSRLGGGGAAT